MDENYILTRLQNGETIDDIADEFTYILNTVNAKYQKQIKEEKAKAERDKNKISAVYNLIDAFNIFYDLEGSNYTITLSDKQALDIYPAIAAMVNSVTIPEAKEKKKDNCGDTCTCKKKNDDTILAEFLDFLDAALKN